MADSSTDSSSQAAQLGILSLLIQAIRAQSDLPKSSTTDSGSKYPPNNALNTPPGSDASPQDLKNWYSMNHGDTFYTQAGEPFSVSGTAPAGSDALAFGQAGVGTVAPQSSSDILKQAEALLADLQKSSPKPSDLTPVDKVPAAPAAPSTPPTPAYDPANTGAISGMMTSQPDIPSIPAVPNTTVPANNPQAVTDMIAANATQAASNPALMASSNQLSGTRTSGDNGIFSRLDNANYLPQQLQHLRTSIPMSGGNNPVPVNSPAYANLQTPGGTTMNLGTLDTAPISQVSSPALGAGGADYAAGGLDSGLASGGYGATGGAASVGGAAGGTGGMNQAAGIGSSVGALITGIGKMFTPGVPGIPSMPSGVPLSQFRPAVMS